jgi:hypothetical protein
VLLTWAIGKPELIAFGHDFKPMAVLTAILLFFLSSGFLLQQKWPSNHSVKCFSYVVIFITVCVSLIVGLQFLFELESPLEKTLMSAVFGAKDDPLGHMSPLTSVVFIIISFAFLFELQPLSGRLYFRQASSVLALAILFISLIIIFSYLAGEPILCSGKTVPMAFPTAILFILLSIGLVIAAGHDTWPLSIFSVEEGVPLTQLRWFAKGPLMIFLCIIIIISVSGFFFLRNQIAVFRMKAQDELSAIADLKARQIASWHDEMLNCANYFVMDPVLSDAIKTYMDNLSDAGQKAKIMAVLESAQKNFHFNRALFIDCDQKMRLCFPVDEGWMGQLAKSFVNETLQSGKVTVSDLHISLVKRDYVNMDVFVPILPTGSDTSLKPIGVLMFEINPSHFLFPTMQSWPSYSRSGETLLVRREGNEVLFLNELRHRKNTALKLHFPIEVKKKLPETMAVMGKEGIVEGVDYRNIPVIAALRKIQGTPWFLVSKVDKDEVKEPRSKAQGLP